jgi:hypothetical protein
MFQDEEARSILSIMSRDIAGIYATGGINDYWKLEKDIAGANELFIGDMVSFMAACENSTGELDHCAVSYYISKRTEGDNDIYELCKKTAVDIPSLAAASPVILSEEIQKLIVETDSAAFNTNPPTAADGDLPKTLTITLYITNEESHKKLQKNSLPRMRTTVVKIQAQAD